MTGDAAELLLGMCQDERDQPAAVRGGKKRGKHISPSATGPVPSLLSIKCKKGMLRNQVSRARNVLRSLKFFLWVCEFASRQQFAIWNMSWNFSRTLGYALIAGSVHEAVQPVPRQTEMVGQRWRRPEQALCIHRENSSSRPTRYSRGTSTPRRIPSLQPAGVDPPTQGSAGHAHSCGVATRQLSKNPCLHSGCEMHDGGRDFLS